MNPACHIFSPREGRSTGVCAILGGAVATVALFVLVGLAQRTSFDPVVRSVSNVATVAPQTPDWIEPPVEIKPVEPVPLPDTPEDFAPDVPIGLIGTAKIDLDGFATTPPPVSVPSSVTPPKPVSKPAPVYPSALLGERTGGRVLVACTVDANGRVAGVSVRESSGHPALDRAALNGLKRWKFRPALRDGKRTRATVVIPVIFKASE